MVEILAYPEYINDEELHKIIETQNKQAKNDDDKILPEDYEVFRFYIFKLKWKNYLERELKSDELVILNEYFSEIHYNKNKIDSLYDKLKEQNLEISKLTKRKGNCLFESLNNLGLGQNVSELRKTLSYLLSTFRDYPNFIPESNMTLKEMFECSNEIEYVKCSSTGKLFRYNYEVMIKDICNDCSWTSLPTQLLLLVLSRFFNIDFYIINKNTNFDNPTIVSAFSNLENNNRENVKKIYLGHILEEHYFPVKKVDDEKEIERKYYKGCYNDFKKFGNDCKKHKIKVLTKLYGRNAKNMIK